MKSHKFTAKYIKAYTKPNGKNIIRFSDENGNQRMIIVNKVEKSELPKLHHWYNWANICKMKNVTDNFRTFMTEHCNFKQIDGYTNVTYVMNLK